MSDLTRQLLYSPPEKRAEVVGHAEQLHDELAPEKNYPIDFVVYRLTERRVPPSESVMLVGEAIKPDLRLLIDALSRSIEMPDDDADPGMTTKQLAESIGVSTKTIARWRDNGLRWRWGVRSGKLAVLIQSSALVAFEKSHTGRVEQAASFSRFTAAEKAYMINRARRLVQTSDVPPQAILIHLSRRTGRSIEALRTLFQQHDKANPEQPVFADRTGPLTDQQKRIIDRAYRRGITVSMLCQRFGKTRSTIYRSIHEARAKRIETIVIDSVYSSIFEREDADEVLMSPPTRKGKPRRLGADALISLSDKLKPIYDRPIDTDDATRSLIVRYNFLKHRAAELRDRITAASPPLASEMDQFDALLERIHLARGEVIDATLPIALSVVLRQQTRKQGGPIASPIPMLYLAHEVLRDEIDQFDTSVAHSFETVLTNRLLRVLAKPVKISEGIDEDALIEQLVSMGFKTEN
ncbi:MAG: hypothetical protein AB8C95_05505 [Phycisphaeraceae bacterium]